MAEVIRMPRLSDTMEEGTIAKWHKKVGDEIQEGDIIAEVETDKATMEMESFQQGTLLYVGIGEGDTVPINEVIAVVGEKGEDYKKVLEEEQSQEEPAAKETEASADKQQSKSEKEGKAPTATKAEPASAEGGDGQATRELSTQRSFDPSQTEGGRINASPLARSMAREKGIDLTNLEGTGDGGRIVKRDINAYLEKEPAEAEEEVQKPVVAGEEGYEDISLSQMRKTIAKRLSESKFTAPHFYLSMEINMDAAMGARKQMNEVSPVKISYNDIIMKAAALAIRKNPRVNVSWMEDRIRQYKHIHLGMAVAVDEGLVVPVLRFADQKTLSQLASESRLMAQKADNKQLKPEDFEGNTFTISNLGMFDIDQFTAIINSPDSCILAVGKIKQTPEIAGGEVQTANIMKVTLSCDHRAVDGAIGSRFLQSFKAFLEEPTRMLV